MLKAGCPKVGESGETVLSKWGNCPLSMYGQLKRAYPTVRTGPLVGCRGVMPSFLGSTVFSVN